MQDQDLDKKWVGLVHVTQQHGTSDVLGENRGAYVTVIAWCEDEQDFEIVVEQSLKAQGLRWIYAEDIEPCSDRIASYQVSDEFSAALKQVSKQRPVVFLTFNSYPIECH